jgi:hypothetical protein
VREYLAQHPKWPPLFWAHRRAADGAAGRPFTDTGLGALSCPLFIVPGGMDEAEIDRLS